MWPGRGQTGSRGTVEKEAGVRLGRTSCAPAPPGTHSSLLGCEVLL